MLIFDAMSNVAEIENAIARLSLGEAEEVREWLEQWLEDQREMTPEFQASIERGRADLAAGRTRVKRS
jgi:predicted outer membrane protein